MLGKNTILKAIHNCLRLRRFLMILRMLGKNTILKAIHNKDIKIPTGIFPANAR